MAIFLTFLLIITLVACGFMGAMWWQTKAALHHRQSDWAQQHAIAKKRRQELETELTSLRSHAERLAKWAVVEDADEKARELLRNANATLSQAQADANVLTANAERQYEAKMASARSEAEAAIAEAHARTKQLAEQAQHVSLAAADRSAKIIAEANTKAEEIAGKAYDALRNAELYERTVRAMKNTIEGYGDEYLKPAQGLLDDLASEFAHKDAGQQLKSAREHTKAMIRAGQASKCEYVEANRREAAEAFVVDAFNGKADSVLSRVRHDNYGKLEQEIKDGFTIVNFYGKAFREARITDEYLAARLSELRWATVAQELRRQEQEEQRRIREQIREEEKARREFERALRDASKEEEVLRKAMAKAEAQIAVATEAQRAKYEAQLADLHSKLRSAEERSQRALSMAQQTKRGHVYIISNFGSFGEGVYKIGLTRRLEPMDRIWELGDASVPFDFDVHAIILSDDAPALENQLHKHFIFSQLNKVNHRKEFFRASLADIRNQIESLGIEAKWTMLADAAEYRESIAIERAIESDPIAREAWFHRQLTLDPVDHSELAAIESD